MPHVRRFYRFTLLVLHIGLGVLLTLAHAWERPNGPAPTPRFRKVRQWWLGKIAHICGLDVTHHGQPINTPALWVSNHISWLDIAVLGGSAPVGFLSKSEVRSWPVVGWLATRAGTLYIERGGLNAATQASASMAAHLRDGHSVVLFAEGTTTDGRTVRRFHPRLFAPAMEHGLAVQPVALRYLDAQGNAHPLVPYINEQSILDNLWDVLGERGVRVEVTFLPAITNHDGQQRKRLAEVTQLAIREVVERGLPPTQESFGQG